MNICTEFAPLSMPPNVPLSHFFLSVFPIADLTYLAMKIQRSLGSCKRDTVQYPCFGTRNLFPDCIISDYNIFLWNSNKNSVREISAMLKLNKKLCKQHFWNSMGICSCLQFFFVEIEKKKSNYNCKVGSNWKKNPKFE